MISKHVYVTNCTRMETISKALFNQKNNTFTSRRTLKVYDTTVMVSDIRTYVQTIKNETNFSIYKETTTSNFSRSCDQQIPSLFQQPAIATYHTNIHNHPLVTYLLYRYQWISTTYKLQIQGLPDTTLVSLVSVVCVSKFQSKHRSSATYVTLDTSKSENKKTAQQCKISVQIRL
jgi:hypothetical protein